jgi:hypothetical protein
MLRIISLNRESVTKSVFEYKNIRLRDPYSTLHVSDAGHLLWDTNFKNTESEDSVFLKFVTLGVQNWKSIIEDIRLFSEFQRNYIS